MAVGSAVASDFLGQALVNASVAANKAKWGFFKTGFSGNLAKISAPSAIGRLVSSYKLAVVPNISDAFPMAHVMTHNESRQFNISTAPQEGSRLLSWDKVRNVMTGSVRYICDGSESGLISAPAFLGNSGDFVRGQFLETMIAYEESEELFQVRMPEYGFFPVNIIGHSIVRDISSIGLLEVDIRWSEVWDNALISDLLTATPEGASLLNTGNVQPSLPNPLVENALGALAA